MLYYLTCSDIACLYDDVRCVRTASGRLDADFFSYLSSGPADNWQVIRAATLDTAIGQFLEWLPDGTPPSDVLIYTQASHPELFI